MRATIGPSLAGIAILALMFLNSSGPAAAKDYPWCVYYDTSTYNCGFTSYAQCMATAQGGQGFCRPNPFVAPAKRQRRPSRN
jgi:hypothetical protein